METMERLLANPVTRQQTTPMFGLGGAEINCKRAAQINCKRAPEEGT